ncbi:CsbD family protein [Billgrantia sp. LNSP4103-1]|uniref:CsbD family protein n=1 Tax=Billgrantia sp. LNSP4103-1 TaxID=3410266 RepID=UPI00403F99F7
MNWDQIEGKWKEMKGKARASWGELSDDELDQIGGKKDELVGKLQQRYGLEREEAERQADEWARQQQ